MEENDIQASLADSYVLLEQYLMEKLSGGKVLPCREGVVRS